MIPDNPLTVREGLRQDGVFDALHDRIPEWLRPSLVDWFDAVQHRARELNLDLDVITRFAERTIRRGLGGDWFLATRYRDDEALLDFLDFLVTYISTTFLQTETDPEGGVYTARDELLNYLNLILEEAGSLWTVNIATTGATLTRRVPREISAAAERASSVKDRAAEHLRKAWRDIYGRDPDPSGGYDEAVKAVESVAGPVILPRNPKRTLGTIIAAVRAKPSKWTFVLDYPDDFRQMEIVADIMDLLWKGQHDRHGKADETGPSEVTQDEAETAVYLAIALVQWFRDGRIRTR